MWRLLKNWFAATAAASTARWWGILDGPEEAQDAMQDAFLKAFQHISEFQGRSKFSTWLISIARNTALQRLRERENVG
jgi:RNA polymerase sigma-70 factor, ECF subfamily